MASNCFKLMAYNCSKCLHILEIASLGRIANFAIFLDIIEFLRFGSFFLFSKQFGFWGILDPPENHASRWIRDFWLKSISLILAYFQTVLSFCVLDIFFFCFSKKLGFRCSMYTLLWYWYYYPHQSRDALSPVYGIFLSLYFVDIA